MLVRNGLNCARLLMRSESFERRNITWASHWSLILLRAGISGFTDQIELSEFLSARHPAFPILSPFVIFGLLR